MNIDRYLIERAIMDAATTLRSRPAAATECIIGTASGYLLVLRLVRVADASTVAGIPIYEGITDD